MILLEWVGVVAILGVCKHNAGSSIVQKKKKKWHPPEKATGIVRVAVAALQYPVLHIYR